MMKKNIWIGCMLAWIIIAGCIDDRGNYDYRLTDEIWPVKISGLEAMDCQVGDQLNLTPTITGTENMENLKYSWFLYTSGVAMSKEDTLSHEKELNWQISREAGSYNLMFEVRDTVRDLFTKKSVSLKVRTFLSTGWFVLETDGTGTDMDMITPEGTTTENLLTTYNSSGRMEGAPRKILYKMDHRHEVENFDGTVEVVKKDAFILTSEKDIRVYDAQNMALLKKREDCFYEMPTPVNPLNRFVNSTTDDHLNNDGQYYILPAGNVGKFGYPLVGPDGTNNYNVHADGVSASQRAFLWDKTSCSFLYASTGSQMVFLSEASGNETNFGPVSKTDKELIHLMYRASEMINYVSKYKAYALWKDGNGKYTIVDLYFDKATYPIVGEYSLPQGNLLSTADIMVTHQNAPKLFFVANGNELWEHNISSNTDLSIRERKVYTFPGGERIACIRHLYITNKYVDEQMDRLVVLTNSADGWKLYGFEFIGGGSEFDMTVTPEEAMIGKGIGEAGYVMRMDNDRAF